jgi:hypothetical protein
MVVVRRLPVLPLLALVLAAAPPASQDMMDPTSLRPPTSRAARAKLKAAAALAEEKWPAAVALLQPLLDAEKDVMVPEAGTSAGARRWVSAAAEAQRLLANLPRGPRGVPGHPRQGRRRLRL